MAAVLERQDKVQVIGASRSLALETEHLVELAESETDPVRRHQLLAIADRLSREAEGMAQLALKLVR